ncbi:helix-turn-helix domain-containing protein [Staphylococcus epidermidis]|uniref:helix-turn-helix domain-containing protein n=1 Tax=Staphylococcus epidermidis TaxID=1282 RepID=UPI00136E0E4E|nr:helix-turn-helix transcriptional regulator [Staphylococcus epidermidis]MCG1317784.1 helix-turn-helix domain-containing protein [Staphylococcus epidermidis]MCG1319987.1 helix-turn-helix domain-containing protein [Staphylococcus epidermidis]MCG1508337.1 helix-turn-helix domain-containing protein [Staphylococcus epidermidis]MCG1558485.1 helix-turn-helix domain-containing protein [Staphylococcus epidermidis]MCG2562722.1 helix-turn-helix domain-containing protein [Staphylococcus epidermidis]
MTNFSDNLSKLRKLHDLSLKELSDRLNAKYEVKFSKASIDRWEKGITSPSMEHASALSDYFNVSLDELSGRNEMKIEEPQTLTAHLEGELKKKDVDYILSLIDRFKNEDK